MVHVHYFEHTLRYALLIAIPLQQWLHEGALVLRYTYVACLVIFHNVNFKYSRGF